MMRLLAIILLCPLLASAQPQMLFAPFMSTSVAAAPAGFSPTNNYPNETVIWLDASLYYTNGGTVFWPDRQTGAFHATNTTAANFPTYGATDCNGVKPAITFDMVNDILRTPTNINYTKPVAWIFLLRYNYTHTNTPPEQRLTSGSDSSFVIRATATSNQRYVSGVNTGTYWTNSATTWMVHTYILDTGNNAGCYTNFGREFSGPGAAPGAGISYAFGGRFSDGALSWNGSISQFVMLTNANQNIGNETLTNAMLSNVVYWMTNYAQLAP